MIDPLEVKSVQFNERDFRIEWYSGSGAGGQHRNKHQNSCRLTHLPTGLVVTSQTRSRHNSLEEAKTEALRRLNQFQSSAAHDTIANSRKQQVGTGERADKIRTYRFQDDVVKDHRTGRQASVEKVLSGNFQLLW